MKKKEYETPEIEFIEFELEDSIAMSGDSSSTTMCLDDTGTWG